MTSDFTGILKITFRKHRGTVIQKNCTNSSSEASQVLLANQYRTPTSANVDGTTKLKRLGFPNTLGAKLTLSLGGILSCHAQHLQVHAFEHIRDNGAGRKGTYTTKNTIA